MRRWWLGLFFACSRVAFGGCDTAIAQLMHNPHRDDLAQYAATEKVWHDRKDMNDFQPAQGIWLENGVGHIRVLSDNPSSHVEVTGEFNDWGRAFPNPVLRLDPNDFAYQVGEIPGLRDGMQYRLIENGQPRLDPAAIQNTTPQWVDRFRPGTTPYLNSIFVDTSKLRSEGGVDLRGKIHALTEESLYELVAKWPHEGRVGPPRISETYRWIAQSGIANEIARANNAVELLPVQGYVDGETWQLHYQVFGNFGPDSRYGTPEEFKAAIRAFHQAGVAVIIDIVPGHYPYRGNLAARDLHDVGLHQWQSHWGKSLYGSRPTEWRTNRYDYENKYVRRFLIDSTLMMMKHYDIDGVRIDNVDGIRDQPGGWQFLQELGAEIRKWRPDAYINGEGFTDHTPVLRRPDWNGLGMDTTNDADFFWNWTARFIRGRTENIDMNVIRDILRNPFQWGTAPRLRFLTNHDESANGGSAFSGAYPATLLSGGGDFYTFNKLKAWNALAMLSGPYSMSNLALQLGQQGDMNRNPQVEWELRMQQGNAEMREFFVRLFQAVKDKPAFGPQSLDPNGENHIDYDNKVLSLQKTDFATGRKYFVLINLGDRSIENYRFGVAANGNFQAIVDSWSPTRWSLPVVSQSEHGKPASLVVPRLMPYQVIVFEQEPF